MGKKYLSWPTIAAVFEATGSPYKRIIGLIRIIRVGNEWIKFDNDPFLVLNRRILFRKKFSMKKNISRLLPGPVNHSFMKERKRERDIEREKKRDGQTQKEKKRTDSKK